MWGHLALNWAADGSRWGSSRTQMSTQSLEKGLVSPPGRGRCH